MPLIELGLGLRERERERELARNGDTPSIVSTERLPLVQARPTWNPIAHNSEACVDLILIAQLAQLYLKFLMVDVENNLIPSQLPNSSHGESAGGFCLELHKKRWRAQGRARSGNRP